MLSDTVISLLASIPIGIATGGYSSLIVAKYSRFANLKNEALRIIRGIEFIGNEEKLELSYAPKRENLSLIASELFFLGHREAGEKISEIDNDLSNKIYLAENGKIGIKEFESSYNSWQKSARTIFARKWPLLSLLGKL